MEEVDLDEVLSIEASGHAIPWGREIFLDCMRAGYYCALLKAKSNNTIQVYGILSIAAGEGHLLNVCVNPTFIRQGYGKMAVLHLLDVAKHNKVNTLFLEVRPSNVIAINLYESLGFLEVGQRKDYYPKKNGGREDALVMAKELSMMFE